MDDLLINDFKNQFNLKIESIKELKDNVVIINDKYVLKQFNKDDFNANKVFENYYKFIKAFRKSIYNNEEHHYMVYDYIEQDKIIDYTKIKIINQIYDVIKEERRYDASYFGYFNEEKNSWYEFLLEEINYSKSIIKDVAIDTKIVDKALKNVKKEKTEHYLLHGDLGAHNFIIKDKIINIIDPIVLVGDYLYDFYYAILSNYDIASSLDFDFILSYFDRKEKYKKSLFIIVYFIRMCRAYKYNEIDFNNFLKDYKYLSL